MSAQHLRILITGFDPFPGAPYNPTPALVARLMRIRRPALSDVTIASHIFPVTYDAVDRDLPILIAQHRPDALLMFAALNMGFVIIRKSPSISASRMREGPFLPWAKAGTTGQIMLAATRQAAKRLKRRIS